MIMKDIQDKLTQCEINQQELWSYRPLSPETLQSLKKLSDSKQIVFKGVAKNGGYESL